MDAKKFFQSKKFKVILYGLGILIVALLIFQAGIWVGYRKAGFSYHAGENYFRTFGGGRHGAFPMGMHMKDFPESHGAIGRVIKINLPTLVMEDRDQIEKVIAIGDDTIVTRLRENIKPADLKVDDIIVVIGSPDDNAQVAAKLIRVLPTPPDYMMGTTTSSNNKK